MLVFNSIYEPKKVVTKAVKTKYNISHEVGEYCNNKYGKSVLQYSIWVITSVFQQTSMKETKDLWPNLLLLSAGGNETQEIFTICKINGCFLWGSLTSKPWSLSVQAKLSQLRASIVNNRANDDSVYGKYCCSLDMRVKLCCHHRETPQSSAFLELRRENKQHAAPLKLAVATVQMAVLIYCKLFSPRR